jgi:hypothetical protein
VNVSLLGCALGVQAFLRWEDLLELAEVAAKPFADPEGDSQNQYLRSQGSSLCVDVRAPSPHSDLGGGSRQAL